MKIFIHKNSSLPCWSLFEACQWFQSSWVSWAVPSLKGCLDLPEAGHWLNRDHVRSHPEWPLCACGHRLWVVEHTWWQNCLLVKAILMYFKANILYLQDPVNLENNCQSFCPCSNVFKMCYLFITFSYTESLNNQMQLVAFIERLS